MEKTIEVPVRFYQLLAAIALDKLEELRTAEETGHPCPLAETIVYTSLERWVVWHDGAEELGLTRLN